MAIEVGSRVMVMRRVDVLLGGVIGHVTERPYVHAVGDYVNRVSCGDRGTWGFSDKELLELPTTKKEG